MYLEILRLSSHVELIFSFDDELVSTDVALTFVTVRINYDCDSHNNL